MSQPEQEGSGDEEAARNPGALTLEQPEGGGRRGWSYPPVDCPVETKRSQPAGCRAEPTMPGGAGHGSATASVEAGIRVPIGLQTSNTDADARVKSVGTNWAEGEDGGRLGSSGCHESITGDERPALKMTAKGRCGQDASLATPLQDTELSPDLRGRPGSAGVAIGDREGTGWRRRLVFGMLPAGHAGPPASNGSPRRGLARTARGE